MPNQEEITIQELNQLIADKELGLTKNTDSPRRLKIDPQAPSTPKLIPKYQPAKKKKKQPLKR